MSLRNIGDHSANVHLHGDSELSEEKKGIPGAKRDALFYQSKHRLPTVSHGEGIYVYDTEGRKYIDGCSGAISANLGHANERVIKAAKKQLEKIAFSYRTQFQNEPANELANLLAQLSVPELDRVFFVNSGSEAVESALKLARQYWWTQGRTGKSVIISAEPSYHGATLGALAATGYAALSIPFRHMLPYFPKVSSYFCYHCPLGKSYPDCGVACAYELEETIATHGAENIAAFIIEPIGGASIGAAVPPEEYFPIVERICHENEILLIVDDVMAGCGRTGSFYSYEHFNITPDIIVTSKGLSGGYTPIGAILASSDLVAPVLESGGFLHGHTYAGNPLSTAITLEVVKTIIDEGLVENAQTVGTYLHEQLRGLAEDFKVIGDVRGRGLFAGIEFVRDPATRESFPPEWYVALEATEIARTNGLLVYPRRSHYGLSGDHILIAPPLIINNEQVDELIEAFRKTLIELTALLDKFLYDSKATVPETFARYHPRKDLPDYATGDIAEVTPLPDANVTAEMDAEQLDRTDLEISGDDK